MHKPSARAAAPLMLAIALVLGGASARAEPPSGTGSGSPAPSSAPGSTKARAKKKASHPGKRRRHGASSGSDARQASDKGTRLVALPDEQGAVYRAFAEHRQELIADAERAARAPQQADRWPSVLFAIRDLDSHAAPAVCFWRAVAYYRLGELARARKTRQLCDLAARDVASLDHEDAVAASLQPPTALPELKMAGELDDEKRSRDDSIKPVANPERYTGPSPSTEQ